MIVRIILAGESADWFPVWGATPVPAGPVVVDSPTGPDYFRIAANKAREQAAEVRRAKTAREENRAGEKS